MNKYYFACLSVPSVLLISGCSLFRGPPGPKLYDNAYIVIVSDNTFLQQQSSDKEYKVLQQSGGQDMIRTVNKRLSEFNLDEFESQGDLKIVPACLPRTLKITEDIENIGASSQTKFERDKVASSDDVFVFIRITIEDCESGKRIVTFTKENSGRNLIAVIKNIASQIVFMSYEYQYGRPGGRKGRLFWRAS